jgi:hypothetical protein
MSRKIWLTDDMPIDSEGGSMTPSLTDWVKALQGDDPAACAAAADSLAAQGAEAVGALQPLLADPRPAVRARAAAVLGQMGPAAKGCFDALFNLLDDPDSAVRDKAAHALEQIAPGQAAGRQHRRRIRRQIGFAAVCLLVILGLMWIVNPFDVCGSVGGLIHGEAFYLLHPTSYWAAQLNGSKEEHNAAWTALRSGEMGARPVLESLATLRPDVPAAVRKDAIRLLGALKREAVVPMLTRLLLEDDDPAIRTTAARVLGSMGAAAESAVPQLYEALNKPDDENASALREAAADALRQIGGDHAVDGVFWQNRPAAAKVCDWKSLAFSADGAMLLAFRDSEIHTWRLAGTPWNVFTSPGRVRHAVIHAEGRRAVIHDGRGQVYLCELRSGDVLARLQEAAEEGAVKQDDGVHQLAASADGHFIALIGSPMRVYDLTQSPHKQLTHWQSLPGTPTLYTAVFAPDGRTLAVASVAEAAEHTPGQRIAAWWLFDVASGKLRCHLPLARQAATFSPDGKWFLTIGQNCRCAVLWDAFTGQQVQTIGDPKGEILKSAAFRGDNRTVALGGSNHYLSLWDAKTGQMLGAELKWHHDPVQALAFSPDGRKLASADDRGWVKLWDLSSLLAPCPPSEAAAIVPWQ